MMGWPFLHPDFLRWTVDMYYKKKMSCVALESSSAISNLRSKTGHAIIQPIEIQHLKHYGICLR